MGVLPLLLVLAQGPVGLTRDAYGVPAIRAATPAAAFRLAGYACAEDRMWQLENSRRLARGKMAEVFGKAFVASDKEILQVFYTDEELAAQLTLLSPEAQTAFRSYAEGVNDFLAKGKLPSGYAENGFKPEPWTPVDSMAIGVRMWQLFGRGGAGELRNWSLLQYANGQPNLKGSALDLLDDFAWINDRGSPPTVTSSADDIEDKPTFFQPKRADTERHLAGLPNVSLLELLPGIRLASREASGLVADARNVASKTGSYAVVVSPARSGLGYPLLLSAPQMGFRNPSVVYELAIMTPEFSVAGMCVPGLPGIAIGHTKDLAWGLTSGVADTDDIVYAKLDGPAHYLVDGVKKPLTVIERTLKVKGEADQKVTQTRTEFGPVVVKSSSGYVFSRRSSYAQREMESYQGLYDLAKAKSVAQVEAAMSKATMNFNFFYALKSGEIGYRYLGLVPKRADGWDPRLPIPAGKDADWQGFVPYAQMPQLRNPQSGLIANWNNKPAVWWPNGDTPVWGRVFRISSLMETLLTPKVNVTDLETAAWLIARKDYNYSDFRSLFGQIDETGLSANALMAARFLKNWDGRNVEGSQGALIFARWLEALREEIFLAKTGNFISMDNFRQVLQPTLILNALEKRTKLDYLGSRTSPQLVTTALFKAVERLESQAGGRPNPLDWRYQANRIMGDIPYSDRGSYIQIIELGAAIRGRNIVTPGVAETGPHSQDQAPLARAWMYKNMNILD